MVDRGDYWYLEPDADPAKITVPELRSILLKHGITYPSAAKKPVLVALFDEQVRAQAAQLQRAQARTKRSTHGIEDMPSSASTTTDDQEGEDEEEEVAPPPTVRRTSRRMRAVTEDEQERHVTPRYTRTPSRPAPTPSRTVPTKHARPSDGDERDEQPARRNRQSSTPAARRPTAEDSPEDSPFTQENPFQSGSSPPAPDTAARERRRRTLGTTGSDQKEKRKSDAFRRRTFQPSAEQRDEGITVPSRRTFDMPVSRVPKQEPFELEGADGVDPGEEFTPEEQLELVRERAQNGQMDVLPPRRRRKSAKATGTLKAFCLTLLATAATFFGAVWRQEKYAVGFCGIGRDPTSLAGVELPEWAGGLLPQCEPCPPHATCYQSLEIICDKDFVKTDHPLALWGLVPLPATCEPDSEKTRRIGLVVDRTVQVLRERNAKFECGDLDAEGNAVESPEVGEVELKKELSSIKRKGMSQDEFDDLFESAVGEVVRRDEIVSRTDGNSTERRLASDSLAELPLGCSIRRSLRSTLERYLWQAALILVLLGSAIYLRYFITSKWDMETRAKQLAGEVFDRLANNAVLNHQEPGSYPDQGISMTQLRDDVLRNEFSPSRRQQLWAKVQKKVELNSNVRAAVRENHSGDVARMWEWVGPPRALADGHGRSSEKRESGRFSLGGAIGSSPPETATRANVQKWEEPRPIY